MYEHFNPRKNYGGERDGVGGWGVGVLFRTISNNDGTLFPPLQMFDKAINTPLILSNLSKKAGPTSFTISTQ